MSNLHVFYLLVWDLQKSLGVAEAMDLDSEDYDGVTDIKNLEQALDKQCRHIPEGTTHLPIFQPTFLLAEPAGDVVDQHAQNGAIGCDLHSGNIQDE
jgi:hypothetical protein